MGTLRYVYVNWKTKDIVFSQSSPGLTKGIPVGRRALKLYNEGYTYYGNFNGWNVGYLSKWIKEQS